MSDSDKSASYEITASSDGFTAAMQKAASAAKQSADQVQSVWGALGAQFKMVSGAFGALVAAMAGGKAFKDSIDAANRLNGEAMALSKALGITGTEASTLRTALNDIGSDSETYIGAFQKFARQVKTNESGLQALGLQTRDSNGHLRDSQTLFEEAIAQLGQYKPGLDQTTFAMTLFGKSVDDAMKLQKLNSQVMEQARQKNKELGLTISTEGVAASKAYKLALNDLGDIFLGIKNVIGQAVMPIFTRLAEWFSGAGPTVVFTFKVAIDALATAVQALVLVFKVAWNVIRALADPLFTFGGALRKLISGDMKGATEDMLHMGDSWGKALAGTWDRIKDDASRSWGEVKNLWGQGTEVAQPNNKNKKTMPQADATGGGLVAQWNTQLEERKLNLQEQAQAEGRFAEMSKVDERAFWQDKLALTKTGSADQLTVRKNLATLGLAVLKDQYQTEIASLEAQQQAYKNDLDARRALLEQEAALVAQKYGQNSKEYEAVQAKLTALAREAAAQRVQIEQITQERLRGLALARVDAEQAALQLDADLQKVGREAVLQAEQQFEQRRFEIKRQALQDRLTLAKDDPDKNAVEIARINAETETLELQHQAKLTDIRNKATIEAQKYTTGLVSGLQSGFQNVFNQIGTNIKTLGGLLQGLMQMVVGVVRNMLASMAADWAINLIKGKVTAIATALGQIQANSAVAGSGGVASMAAAPFPLNLGAPAFGASMAAASMAFAAGLSLPSAAGGWEVPRDTLAMVHQNEMILPASIAQPLKQQVEGGGAAAAPVVNHFHIHATDAESVRRLLVNNSHAVAEAVQRAQRNFQMKR